MFTTAAQRTARARERFDLSSSAAVVMTSPAGGFIWNDAAGTEASGSLQIRNRIMEHLGLELDRIIVDRACAVAVDGPRVLFVPLNASNTDFAEPIEVRGDDVRLRWWDSGGRANLYCRMWFTLADGRWALLDVPRKALFMRSKFAVGLDDVIAALRGEHMDPAPDAEA